MVVAELPERGRGWVVLDSAGGAGAATVAVITMDGEMPVGSPNVGTFITECMMVSSGEGSS